MFLTVAGVPYGRSRTYWKNGNLCERSDVLNTFSSFTPQGNFAGSCHATSCGHSERQSTRFDLMPLPLLFHSLNNG